MVKTPDKRQLKLDYTRRKYTARIFSLTLFYFPAMSYLFSEAFKVPGPTKYFQGGHPLMTFTFENAEMNASVLQGKNAPSWS